MENHIYNVNLRWNAGRKGIITSPELPISIEVATPPEFEGGIPNIWSPEHLFTASVVSCFMTTFLAISTYSKVDFTSFNCNSDGILEKVDGKFLMTKIILKVDLIISKSDQLEKAKRVLEKSEAACLISNSIKSEVILETNIVVEN